MRAFILCLLVSFTGELALAKPISEQRQQFKDAYNARLKTDLETFQQQAAALKGYPLHPYMEYQALKKDLSKLNQSGLDAFSKKYADTPLPWQLNRAWLSYLFKNKRWQDYRTAFARKPVNNDLYQCRLQIARLKTGAKAKALAAAPKLWLVGRSQHETCDPLFDAWKKTGKPTSSLALTRFWLAVKAGNIKLARYIERSISNKKHQKQTKLFWAISKDPTKVKGLKPSQISRSGYPVVVEYGFKRWASRDRIKATEGWLSHRKQLIGKLPKTDKNERQHAKLVAKLNRTLALRLAVNYEDEAEPLISRLDKEHNIPEVTEWRIRVALAKQDWKLVKSHIRALPKAKRQSERWQYWYAIASTQLNDKYNITQALKTISGTRSYYGFLAADINNQPYRLNKHSIAAPKPTLNKLATIPGLVRARELHHHGLIVDANREWAMVMRKLSKDQQLMAGYLALSWGWHNRAINTAIDTRQWDELAIRFPQPHRSLFEQNARQRKIDRIWPLAIARQESAFKKNARSHAGARGLMQLMPATAKRTAKKHKVPYRRLAQLNNPTTNIALGTAYLGEMYDRFGHNKAYATAAYNAGPHRVDRWLKERGNLPLDIWIETIPFKETRRYVQNVLAFRVIYERLGGRAGNMLSDNEEKLLALNFDEQKRKSL